MHLNDVPALGRRTHGDARLRSKAHAREAGQVLVLFALGVFVMLGAIGVGVDGSRALEERRNAQAAVDHAALTAARSSCNGADEATAIAAGQASATTNAFPDSSPTIVVDIQRIPNVDPGESDDHAYRARITSTISNTFARVLGINTFDVGVEASAGGLGCGSSGATGANYAVFAGGASCPNGSLRNIKISGNDHTVNGRTHTNGGVDHSGNRTAMKAQPHALTYVWPDGTGDGRSMFSGGGNTYDGPKLQTTTQEAWPTGYAPTVMDGDSLWNAYKAAMVNGPSLTQSTFESVNLDGVWYTENSGGVDVKAIRAGWRGVIVSRSGPIKISIDLRGGTFHAPTTPPAGTPADVILVSGYAGEGQPCDKAAIERPGNTGVWDGIWWAPRAQARIAGERTTVNKGIISHALQMEGNYHVINGGSGPSSPSGPTIVVLQ